MIISILLLFINWLIFRRFNNQNKGIQVSYFFLSLLIAILNIYFLSLEGILIYSSDAYGYFSWANSVYHDVSFLQEVSFKYWSYVVYNMAAFYPFISDEITILLIYFNNLLISVFIFSYLVYYYQQKQSDERINIGISFVLYLLIYSFLVTNNLREILMISLLIFLFITYRLQPRFYKLYYVIAFLLLVTLRYEMALIMFVSLGLVLVILKFNHKNKYLRKYFVILSTISLFIIPSQIDFSDDNSNKYKVMKTKILKMIYIPVSTNSEYSKRIDILKNTTGNRRGELIARTYFERFPSLFFSYYPLRYWEMLNEGTLFYKHLQGISYCLTALILTYVLFPLLIGTFSQYSLVFSSSLLFIISFYFLFTGFYLIKFQTVDLRIVLLFLPLFILEFLEIRHRIKILYYFIVVGVMFYVLNNIDHLKKSYFYLSNKFFLLLDDFFNIYIY